MEEFKYIEILIEDKSGEILCRQIMDKYKMTVKEFGYDIHGFKGIGKIPTKIKKTTQIKTKKLLSDLPLYLTGIGNRLKNMPYKTAIFVILDCDDEDCVELKKSLVKMYNQLEIDTNVVFCIAIEEMEAWLLGDKEAVQRAFPSAKQQLLQKYVPDSIVGTWEKLADIVYKGGVRELRKNATSYYEIGLFKCECAKKIGMELDIRKNESPSFNYFVGKLDEFCEVK